MRKKAMLAVLAALILGIGGTVAYFWLHDLYVAHTAPPITAVQPVPAADNKANQAGSQGAVIPPAGNAGAAAGQGTLNESQLVLANISYGAAIDAVRQRYGEPYEIKQKQNHPSLGNVSEYEYKNTFELYVANGVVQKIKVDETNGLGTAQGIMVGSSAEAVVAAYGQPNEVKGDHYIYRCAGNQALGLDFEIEHNRVDKIECGVL